MIEANESVKSSSLNSEWWLISGRNHDSQWLILSLTFPSKVISEIFLFSKNLNWNYFQLVFFSPFRQKLPRSWSFVWNVESVNAVFKFPSRGPSISNWVVTKSERDKWSNSRNFSQDSCFKIPSFCSVVTSVILRCMMLKYTKN